jgi:hypothetical protein
MSDGHLHEHRDQLFDDAANARELFIDLEPRRLMSISQPHPEDRLIVRRSSKPRAPVALRERP